MLGCIINIGSVVGEQGSSGQSVYSASKAGLEGKNRSSWFVIRNQFFFFFSKLPILPFLGFTKSLAKEVGSRGIRVNLISPGFIETDMTKGS